MRNKMIIGAAGVGLLVAGVVSAANLSTTAVAGSTLAAGNVNVSGANLADVEFQLDAEGTNLDKVKLTLTQPGTTTPLEGANVVATVGSATSGAVKTDAQGVAVVDITPNVSAVSVTSINVVVAS